jgi:acyl-CoA reductase-like NAD-dependent aldehyde dehydrogenase
MATASLAKWARERHRILQTNAGWTPAELWRLLDGDDTDGGPVSAVTDVRRYDAPLDGGLVPAAFGLVAGIWTRDVGTAHRLAGEIEAGQVFVNTYGAGGGVELPFGGRKLSGHGRERGLEGLLGFTRTKTVAVDLG